MWGGFASYRAHMSIFVFWHAQGLCGPTAEELQRCIIFQHEGVRRQWSKNMQSHLDETLSGRWTPCGVPFSWFPCSIDIVSLGFLLWGYVKNCAYTTSVGDTATFCAAMWSVAKGMLLPAQAELDYWSVLSRGGEAYINYRGPAVRHWPRFVTCFNF
jgi:hypothetical protein